MNPLDVVGYLWIIFAIVWLTTAFTAKKRVRSQSGASRFVDSALLAIAWVLLIRSRTSAGILEQRFLPETPGVRWLGVAVTSAGFALAFWARYVLGRNWSGVVSISENHELVRRGPYAYVRNPIYSGILLAMFGTAIGFGRVEG